MSTTYRGSLGGLILALLIAVSLAWPLNAAAQPPGAVVAIDPPQIAVDSGATFSVTVTIADVAELQSYEFTVQFDPAVVQVEEVERGPFLEGKSPVSLGPQIDNEAGTVTFGALAMGSGPWPGGDGQLATLSLRAVAQGRTALELRRVSLFDGDGDALTAAVEDGTVQVGDDVPTDPPPPATPEATVTPTRTATPTGAATAAPDATATPPGTATEVVTPGPDVTASPTGAATATEMAPVGPDATATADPAPLTETGTPAEAAGATSTAQAGQTPELVEGAPEAAEPGQDVGHDVQPTGPGSGEDAGATTAAGFRPWLVAAVALLTLAGLALIGVGTFATGLFRPEPQPVDDTAHDQTA